jgi:lycopene elongase/hydratase (dihydrobisanhydrobacterioruberin-forming)
VAALYLPTTLVDEDADRRAGIRTTAVVLGRRTTFAVGFALWTASAVAALAMALGGVVIDRSLLPLHLLVTPGLLLLYWTLLKEPKSFTPVIVVAGAYLVPCTAFILTYISAF